MPPLLPHLREGGGFWDLRRHLAPSHAPTTCGADQEGHLQVPKLKHSPPAQVLGTYLQNVPLGHIHKAHPGHTSPHSPYQGAGLHRLRQGPDRRLCVHKSRCIDPPLWDFSELGIGRNGGGSPKAMHTCVRMRTHSWQHRPQGEVSTCPIPEQGAGAAARQA